KRGIGVGGGKNSVCERRVRAQAHEEKRGAEIAEQERSVGRIVAPCELDLVVLNQAGQGRAEIEGGFGRAHPPEIVEGPDDAGRPEVKTRGAVRQAILARMCRPEIRLIKIGERVSYDFPDRRSRLGGVPGDWT